MAICEQVTAFWNGELAPAEAEAFREHFVDCEVCLAELDRLVFEFSMMEHRRQQRALCDQLAAFDEGLLSPEAAEVFRAHLGQCERCQGGLRVGLMIEGLARPAAVSRETKVWAVMLVLFAGAVAVLLSATC